MYEPFLTANSIVTSGIEWSSRTIISRPFASVLLIRFATGSRAAGVASLAGAVVVGFVDLCCVTTRAESVEGDNMVNRSRKASKHRFTDDSICWQLMLIVGKWLSCNPEKSCKSCSGLVTSFTLYRINKISQDSQDYLLIVELLIIERAFLRRAVR